jgi:hypothetical protein
MDPMSKTARTYNMKLEGTRNRKLKEEHELEESLTPYDYRSTEYQATENALSRKPIIC